MSEIVKTVLLVDDDRNTRDVWSQFLVHSGLQVRQAADGEAAMEVLRADPPDLVLMDLSLPVIDGWTLTTLIKGDPRTNRIPVIVISAHVFAEHRERALEAGCDAFLAKPCLPADLLREVRRFLHLDSATGDGTAA
jgi:two-component system, cell cycle response regulator DivK